MIRIFEFLSPEYLNISISWFSNIFMKNNWIVINMINGNISKIDAGEFNKDKKRVKLTETFSFLKNSNSVKRFKINTKLIIIKKTNKSDFKKIEEMNLI